MELDSEFLADQENVTLNMTTAGEAGMEDGNGHPRSDEEVVSRMPQSLSLDELSPEDAQVSHINKLSSLISTSISGSNDLRGTRKRGRLSKGHPKTKVEDEIPAFKAEYVLYNEDKTKSITLHFQRHKMNSHRVITKWCHVTKDGQLINKPRQSKSEQNSQTFRIFWGTYCSNLPLTRSYLLPPTPQYWETETAVEVKKSLEWWRLVLEVGVVEEDMLDSAVWVYDKPRSWCVIVGGCDMHEGYCTQVWNQKKLVACVKDTVSDIPGTSYILRYGVAVDVMRGRIGFVDVNRGTVLSKLDVEFGQTTYPVFSVDPFPDYLNIKMALISGTEIKMTDAKQKLIFSCLK